MSDLPIEQEAITTRRFTDNDGNSYELSDDKARQGLKIINEKFRQQEETLNLLRHQMEALPDIISQQMEEKMLAKLNDIGEMKSLDQDKLRIALALCKSEMGCSGFSQTSKGEHTNAAASLGNLQDFANPFLMKHGLSIDFEYYEINKKDFLKGIMTHISGQFKSCLMEVKTMSKGYGKEIRQSDIESAYTYTKKRLFALFLGFHCGG